MNNPMKASAQLKPSSKAYFFFFQWFNNAKGSLLVVYTHYLIDYNWPQWYCYCHIGCIKGSAFLHVSKLNASIRSDAAYCNFIISEEVHSCSVFRHFPVACSSRVVTARTPERTYVCAHTLMPPFSIWLKHMIALAWCPLTSSCLSHPDRGTERIRARRKARGEP